MTREEKEKLIRHLKYNLEIGADCFIADEDAVEIIKTLKQEPCKDCISRQAAIRIAEQGQVQCYEWQFKELIKLPSVKPQQRTGRWIVHDHGLDAKYHQCPICLGFDRGEKGKYCKWCGAKMVEPQESEG